LAQNARSLITPILVTNPEAFEIVCRVQDREVDEGDFMLELAAVSASSIKAIDTSPRIEREIEVLLVNGFHARPAARIANVAKKYDADIVIVTRGRRAKAKSPTTILALGVQHRERIRLF